MKYLLLILLSFSAFGETIRYMDKVQIINYDFGTEEKFYGCDLVKKFLVTGFEKVNSSYYLQAISPKKEAKLCNSMLSSLTVYVGKLQLIKGDKK
jgi:hypothetical protein